MILSIIGIVLGVIAIGLIFWFRKDQKIANDLIEDDFQAMERSYTSLMTNFTNYQVETDRKIFELEKKITIKSKESERKIMKVTESLPAIIRNVVGHIEFARPLDKK